MRSKLPRYSNADEQAASRKVEVKRSRNPGLDKNGKGVRDKMALRSA